MLKNKGTQRHERLILLSLLIGVVCGIAAIALHYSFAFVTGILVNNIFGYTSSGSILRPYMVPIIMGSAALLGGLIIFFSSKEAEGHGADTVIKSFHKKNGHVRKRVAIVELVTSSLTIGSGGSAGGEGPIALICASLGSTVSTFLGLDDEDRKIISAVAVGSGIAAILKAPLGGAVFGAEFLYRRDMEVKVIYPSLIASVISFAIYGAFVGYGPLFGDVAYSVAFNLIPFFIAVGLASGALARLYIKTYHTLAGWFHRLNLHEYAKPVLGAFFASIVILIAPETLGEGISWISYMANGNVASFTMTYGLPIAIFFLLLALLKILATSLTIGSGASGGVFIPGLFIGGSLGLGIGLAFNALFPNLITVGIAGIFAVVGMVSMFGATAKVPISLAIIGMELVGNLQIIPFIIVAVFSAYVISGSDSIFRSQVHSKELDLLISGSPPLSH